MDKLKSLLNQINLILAREKAIKQEKLKRGENFNIFSTLNLSKNETRLHSAFIAELLNPKGAMDCKIHFSNVSYRVFAHVLTSIP